MPTRPKIYVKGFVVIALSIGLMSSAFAHFGMIIPSSAVINQETGKDLELILSFSHPFANEGMDMAKPKQFSVFTDGKKFSLVDKLSKTKVMEHTGWKADYKVKRPNVYQFYMEPSPYWEPAEDCYIIHYTKVIIPAFGIGSEWNKEIGLKAEIIPLTRPFGLYAGNTFQGIVKFNGKIVPFATVEVSFYNEGGKVAAANSYLKSQTIKADKNGVFTYTAPASGWWGFAALNTSDKKIKHNGSPKNVELGAIIWVKFFEWNSK
jgi:cobalt/nickel transport protein